MRRSRCDLRGGRLRYEVGAPRFEVSGWRVEVGAIVDSIVMGPGGVGSQGSPLREVWGSRELGISLQQVRGSHWGPRACVLQSSRSSTTFYRVLANSCIYQLKATSS